MDDGERAARVHASRYSLNDEGVVPKKVIHDIMVRS